MNTPRRIFTAQEDQLMLMQSRGDFSMHKLERMIRSSREAIIQRMYELGVRPVIMRHARGFQNKLERISPADGNNAAPSVGSDKLLQQLLILHGDRRYG